MPKNLTASCRVQLAHDASTSCQAKLLFCESAIEYAYDSRLSIRDQIKHNAMGGSPGYSSAGKGTGAAATSSRINRDRNQEKRESS